ncbi:MAG TPA: ABC transporter permease [Acidimicrobiales bacterium]|nr:ABC transporter permease [Acidimicrobiales bacterium]
MRRTVTPEKLGSPLWLAVGETRMQLRLLRRNPVSVLFTVALPLLLLPLLDALQGDVLVQLPAASAPASSGPIGGVAGRFPWMQYATPAIAAFAVVTACFANLAIRTAVARESGVLKRVRGTPLPPAAHLTGRILSNVLVALLVAAVTLAAGVTFYDVEVALTALPVLALLVVLGAAVFSALGLATTTVIPNADAAPAVVYAVLFPLAFLSNVFYPPELAPEWMERTSEALPLGPFVSAMVGAATPSAPGTGVLVGEIAAMVGWGIFGLCVSLVAFGWVPHRERAGRVTSRRSSLQRLAIPLGMAAAVVGVLVPEVRPVEQITVGTPAQLEQEGIITTQVVVDSSRITYDRGDTDGVDDAAQLGFDTLVSFEVSIIDRGDGGEAFGFQGCGIEPVSAVDAEWLGDVTPSRRGGAFVQTCNGSVYDTDLTCTAGPCFGPLVMPTSVSDGEIRVSAEGTLRSNAPSDIAAPPVPAATYQGAVIVDDGAAVTTTFELASDERGVALVDVAGGLELRFVSQSPWLGTISGFDALGPPDRSELVTTFFSTRPVPFASVPVGGDRSVQEFDVRLTTSRPSSGQRLLTFGPVDDADVSATRGLVRLITTGDLLRWTAIELDVQVAGQPHIQADLVRTT